MCLWINEVKSVKELNWQDDRGMTILNPHVENKEQMNESNESNESNLTYGALCPTGQFVRGCTVPVQMESEDSSN